LKRALAGRVPSETLKRKKQGFAVPIGTWFRTSWRRMAEELLYSSTAAHAGLLRQEAVTALVQAHVSGTRESAHAVWALLMVELWHRRWMRPGNALSPVESTPSTLTPC